jgi:hypothetical protein
MTNIYRSTGTQEPSDWWVELMAKPVVPAAVNLVTVYKMGARKRARVAAGWVEGRIHIRPTVTNAATVFNVNGTYVHAARGNGKIAPKTDPLTSAWNRTNAAERKAFVTANAEILWSMMDEITASPTTPHLIAAE